MYRDPTSTHIVRAVGTWIFTFAVLATPMFLMSLRSAATVRTGVIGLGVVALGAGINYGARLRLDHLDRISRPYLMSPAGLTVLKDRYGFAARVTRAKRVLLALFLVAGTILIFVITFYTCEERTDGVCGLADPPSDATIAIWQSVAAGLGGLYIAAVVLGRTHEAHTDRIAMIISEGEQKRRGDDPFAGVNGRWD